MARRIKVTEIKLSNYLKKHQRKKHQRKKQKFNWLGKTLFACLILNIVLAFYFAYLGDMMCILSVISGIFCHIGIRSKNVK